MLDLSDIFGPEGPLERALPDFKVRRQQLLMAERVAAAVDSRETLAVEAGTGTGKTFAYLVPALLSGVRVLISTGTRTLQDQLFSKDLPLVAAALGRPAKVALLKGRSNYLCRYRLARADAHSEQLELDSPLGTSPLPAGDVTATAAPVPRLQSSFNNRAAAPEKILARIRSWARTPRMGDLSEVRGLSDSHAVWPQVTSTRENCLGNRCPEMSRCHVAVARRQALDSDIVIVNHHLLLADLTLKEDGFGDILGSADAVILDEAHQIPDLVTQFFGANVSSRQIDTLLKEAQLEATAHVAHASPDSEAGATAARIIEVVRAVEQGVHHLSSCLPAGAGRLAWREIDASLGVAAEELAQSLQNLRVKLGSLDGDSPLAQIGERAGELALRLERIAAVDEMEGARAVEISARGFALSL